MKKHILLLTLICLTAAACFGGKKTDVPYTVLNGGEYFSKTKMGARVFNSEAEFRGFLMARSLKISDVVSGFDFSDKSLLVAYLGREKEDGSGLIIESITEDADTIYVKGSLKKEAPYIYYISIPKTEKKGLLKAR